MSQSISQKFWQNHLETEEKPLKESVRNISNPGKMHPTTEVGHTEELEFQGISRNKRAVIERIIALWAIKSKIHSYGNNEERVDHEST
ncbi:MAG: hypothetical protein VKL59_06805 [Nostocaceae cyanobacterium]|nr:hypothetical protein [Nostocaceae cyanobacterium]